MSKRCRLQKEFYQTVGNYKGKGQYSNQYVAWLEDKVINNHILKEDATLRTRALNLLREEMSENTLKHIKEIDYLEDWIVDAMINFHNNEVETY
jgi:hypothetical protein